MLIQELYSIYLEQPSIQTDTRQLKNGDLFFALKGPHFNGNKFAKKALEAGASYAVIDEAVEFEDERLISTNDVLQTLQELAKYHRQQFSIPFIAITGSNGKTTTKELVNEVLASTYKTYTTKGNLNNHIGVPLTILSIKADAEMAVIEMGANHQKEIESYCEYTMPTHGIITNIGKAHLEGFGGEAGVKKGKGELFDYLNKYNGAAFIMNDYADLVEMSKTIAEVVTYGTINADLTGHVLKNTEFLQVVFSGGTDIQQINTNLVGEYNLPNILAAVTVGKYFKVEEVAIKKALESYMPSNSRSQLVEKGTNKIILDAYNANPTSMKAAIENFAKMDGDDKVLLLGGMMELGETSLQEHAAIVDLIIQYKWKSVVLVGGDFEKLKNDFIYFNKSLEAKKWFKDQHFTNTRILVKGSRSMQMEKIVEED
ncbi:UDP-N-acetylmuramoyl-tripeptide--D-alanyl-D-alanine ligase [soil metagenome]